MPRPRKYRPAAVSAARRAGEEVRRGADLHATRADLHAQNEGTAPPARARGVDRFGRPLSRAEGTNPRALACALGMSPRQLRDFCPLLTEDEATGARTSCSLSLTTTTVERLGQEEREQFDLSPAQIANRNSTGLCRCGCGRLTPRATQSHRVKGWVNGESLAYLKGHHLRAPARRAGANRQAAAVSSLPSGRSPPGADARRLTDKERGEVEDLYHRYHEAIAADSRRASIRRGHRQHFAEDLYRPRSFAFASRSTSAATPTTLRRGYGESPRTSGSTTSSTRAVEAQRRPEPASAPRL